MKDLRTFYLEDSAFFDDQAIITGSDVHHLVKVLRMGVGDSLLIRNFSGIQYQGKIQQISSQKVTVILSSSESIKKNQTPIWLYLGLPKIPTLKPLIRQITELGVSGLQLVMMERSTVKKKDVNIEKLEKISLEAMKQCLRAEKMMIELVKTVDELVSTPPPHILEGKSYLANESSEFKKQFFHELNSDKSSSEKPILLSGINLWVGPEGGITLTEQTKIEGLGFESVSLSEQILRVDTAVLFFLAKFL